jgi:FtsZ-binding cell division protein ZapB
MNNIPEESELYTPMFNEVYDLVWNVGTKAGERLACAKIIYQQFIEPLQKELKELKEKNYRQRQIICYNTGSSTDETKTIMRLEKELKELREEKDNFYGSMQDVQNQLIEAGREIERLKAEETEQQPEGKVDIDSFYEKWKKETKRNGGVLIGSSIKELLNDFYKLLQPQVEEGNKTKEEK